MIQKRKKQIKFIILIAIIIGLIAGGTFWILANHREETKTGEITEQIILHYIISSSKVSFIYNLIQHQQISAPEGISFSGVISARLPSASSAHNSIPSEVIPASCLGFRFTRTITFFPTISSAL